MTDSITLSNAIGISTLKAGQQVAKAEMNGLLASIEQAGQAALQSPANRVDRVQISAEAQRRLAAEQSGSCSSSA